ncbi:MAG: molybdenum cofactor biosynthesis protein [Desulfobulbus propionicus]|nr:MAG: molybdenum cofactor biosynthesis protein [Desulfobulbus propionicus]
MDISKTLAELKKRPDFNEHVGMVLIHNGTVRAWSRRDHCQVSALEVTVDENRLEALRREYLKKPGIYEILIEAASGRFHPGDDLLFIIVAGDLREHLHPVLAELLNRVKAEAIRKHEISA